MADITTIAEIGTAGGTLFLSSASSSATSTSSPEPLSVDIFYGDHEGADPRDLDV